jgi:hypothetical protein
MKKKFVDLYVVAKNEDVLFDDCVYDFATAEKVCSMVRNLGYSGAQVITLAYAIHGMYSF